MKNNKPKYVIIVSLDAVGEKDIEYLRKLSNFSEFYKNAAYCDKVLGVYPTLTYPSHTSIITGVYPNRHGVTNNVLIQPKRRVQDWKWQRKYIKVDTLYDYVKKSGGTVASFLWPVTAKSKNIDFHIPEIFANRWWDKQVFTSLRNGSKIFQLKMFLKYKHLLKGINQPELDNFTFNCAIDTLKKHKPNLTLIHLTDVDTQKHYGTADDIKRSLDLLDDRLGELVLTLKNEGIYDETLLVLLGDHSQLNADYIVYPNTFFKEKGWLEYDEDKKIIKNYKVLARDCDGSCYVYINPKYRKKLYPIVKSYLNKIKACGKYGIEEILTSEEAFIRGADGNCDFMLEAKVGYYFQNQADNRIYKINKQVDGKNDIMLATHGYSPNKKEYHTIFAVNGVGVKCGATIEEMCLVDEAPTLAEIMGFSMDNVDGKVIKEFIQYDK